METSPSAAPWADRFRPRGSKAIEARRRQVSPAVGTIAQRAQWGLCRRYRRLVDRGKPTQKVVTAVAHELPGFVWAIAHEEK